VSDPQFLTKQDVLDFHAQQIALFGGDPGLGDEGMLESALGQPPQTYFYNQSTDLFDLASAYAFHIAKNHPFNDGNKRTALEAGLAFLEANGTGIIAPADDLYDAMIRLTTSEWNKDQFADFLRRNRRPA
jgi:death on curing protein